MKKYFNLGKLGLISLLLFSPFVLWAQEEQVEKEPVVVARVNVYDARIISQEGHNFKIEFNLNNEEYVQGQIKYGVRLFQTAADGRQTEFDSQVFPEVLSLNQGETVFKEIEYQAPAFLQGKFEMMLVSQNEKGLFWGIAPLGSIELKSDQGSLRIDPTSCYLTLNKAEKRYELGGVPMKNEDDLKIHCSVENYLGREIVFGSKVDSYAYSDFGQMVASTDLSPKEKISADEKRDLALNYTTKGRPGTYAAKFFLVNEQGETVSNKITFYYFLAGNSATIQNVRLNKDGYREGEIAQTFFNWSAQDFFSTEEQMSYTASPKKYLLELFLQNSRGEQCASPVQKQLTNSEQGVLNFEIPIKEDCYDFDVVASIKDEEGNLLDENSFQIKNTDQSNQKANQTRKMSLSTSRTILAILLLTITGGLVLVFFQNKKKLQNKFKNKNKIKK